MISDVRIGFKVRNCNKSEKTMFKVMIKNV